MQRQSKMTTRHDLYASADCRYSLTFDFACIVLIGLMLSLVFTAVLGTLYSVQCMTNTDKFFTVMLYAFVRIAALKALDVVSRNLITNVMARLLRICICYCRANLFALTLTYPATSLVPTLRRVSLFLVVLCRMFTYVHI